MSTTRKTKTAPKAQPGATVKTAGRKTLAAANLKAASKTATARKADSPGDDQIAALAYEIWERAGRPEGRSDEHWREAEARLRGASQAG